MTQIQYVSGCLPANCLCLLLSLLNPDEQVQGSGMHAISHLVAVHTVLQFGCSDHLKYCSVAAQGKPGRADTIVALRHTGFELEP